MDYNFNVEKTTNELISWIRDWFEQNGKDCNAVIGMSGGKDSTIVAKLMVEALGKDRVIGVMMPDFCQDLNDADKICEYLGIRCFKAPICGLNTPLFNPNIVTIKNWTLNSWSVQAKQNIPPRLRMVMLYAISQTFNGRVINTCNLSENFVGYETIYGDGAGDMSPLGNLTVTEVLQIGDYLKLPKEWVHKTPDDGLPNSCPDEKKFGFTYAELDDYIRYGKDLVKPSVVEKIEKMHKDSEFKRKPMSTFKF